MPTCSTTCDLMKRSVNRIASFFRVKWCVHPSAGRSTSTVYLACAVSSISPLTAWSVTSITVSIVCNIAARITISGAIKNLNSLNTYEFPVGNVMSE